MASSGDIYPCLSDHENSVNSGFVDVKALKNYIQYNSPLQASEFAAQNNAIRK